MTNTVILELEHMKDISKIILSVTLIAILLVPTNAFAITYQPPITIQNPTPVAFDNFGWSVSISGDKVLIGAYLDDTGAGNAGAAYLFDGTTGNLLQTFTSPTPVAFDNFGWSVSISGDNVLIGAYLDDTGAGNAGAAYLFDGTTGNLLQTFTSPTPVAFDNFGWSVSISGDNVLIGANQDDTGATNAGAAYLFDGTTGNLLQTFNNPTPVAFDLFGNSVSISGDNVLVGAILDDTGATNAGAAYLFDGTTGNLLQTFNNPTPATDDQFGISVSISGDNVLIGAILDDTGATNAGAAYLFDGTTGNLLQTFNNPTPAAGDQFGHSVSISGDKVLVGARFDDTGATNAGAAYLFDGTTGALLQTFNNPTPAANDNFGISVSISGDNVLIGANLDDTGATDAGAAYLFDGTTGNLLQTFQKTTPVAFDNFGWSVSISGDNVLIGSIHDDTGATDAGAAYLFDGTTGALLQTFNNPTPVAFDQFGWSVSISGDNVLIGSIHDDTGATDAGAAYLFDGTTGNLLQTFTSPTPATDDQFGISVSISGDNVLVGARFDDTGATDAGAAYLFLEDSSFADLSIQKIPLSDTTQPGGNISFDITVTNNGPDAAENVIVTDVIPEHLTVDSYHFLCADSSGIVTCNLDSIDAGQSKTVRITFNTNTDALVSQISNTASVSSDSDDPNPDDNSDTSVIPNNYADLRLTKTASVSQIGQNGLVTYSIRVVNDGPSTSDDIKVFDYLPDGATFVEYRSYPHVDGACLPDPIPQCVVTGSPKGEIPDLNFIDISLDSGQALTIEVDVILDGSSGTNLENTALVVSSTFDPNESNNQASVSILINSPPVANAGGPYTIQNGDRLALDGSLSSDPDTGDSIVSYEWDLNYDGIYDVTGSNPVISTDTLSGFTLDVPHPILLKVTDSFGAPNRVETTFTIISKLSPPVIPPSADVDPGATIGDGTVLGENVIVSKDSTIGQQVTIGDNSNVDKNVIIGDDSQIGTGVSISKDGNIGTNVQIGNNVSIDKNVQIGNGVIIGNNVVIGKDSTIADGAIIPDGTVLAKNSTFP